MAMEHLDDQFWSYVFYTPSRLPTPPLNPSWLLPLSSSQQQQKKEKATRARSKRPWDSGEREREKREQQHLEGGTRTCLMPPCADYLFSLFPIPASKEKKKKESTAGLDGSVTTNAWMESSWIIHGREMQIGDHIFFTLALCHCTTWIAKNRETTPKEFTLGVCPSLLE